MQNMILSQKVEMVIELLLGLSILFKSKYVNARQANFQCLI